MIADMWQLVLVEAEAEEIANVKQVDWQGEDEVVEGEKRGRSEPGRGDSRLTIIVRCQWPCPPMPGTCASVER